MNMTPRFQGWIATLSDGSTAFEVDPLPGERTSWQKLIDHLKANDLKITGLQLQRGGIVLHALPAKSVDGFYQAYEVHRIVFRDQTLRFQGVGSVIGDQVYITWVNEQGQVYPDIRPLSSERPHTTLRP